jgi:flagellar FliJ protein
MKRFSFRLESYLRLCRHREELEQVRLAELVTEAKRVRDTLATLLEALKRTKDELGGRRTIRVYEVGWYRQRIRGLQVQIEQTESQLANLQDLVIQQRLRLIEARKKRKIVEKLRTNRLNQHQRQVELELQKQMDDLYLQRLHRNGDGTSS